MYSTRSLFPMAPVINRPVVVISHGSPSEPDVQEAAVQDLARRLNLLLSDTTVHGATLAAKGALSRAVKGLHNPIICPWFMSDGWFVGTYLPKRLRSAGLERWQETPSMGQMPGIATLMVDRLNLRLSSLKWDAAQTTVILAAHGSPTSTRPRTATENAARALADQGRFKAVSTCYVDEPPAIRDVGAGTKGPAIVLPFFAARAGHVTGDLPRELSAACFDGPVLDPVGIWPETPALAQAAISTLLSSEAA